MEMSACKQHGKVRAKILLGYGVKNSFSKALSGREWVNIK